jgi:hypothetical protein
MVADRSESRLILEDSVPPPWVGQKMTLDAFLGLPTVKPNLEYTDGLVTQKVAAKPTHGSLQTYLATTFNQIAGPRHLGMGYSETRFVTPTWAPVPDVSYYRRERIQLRGLRQPADFTEAPDIAVEIVSPGQSVTELILAGRSRRGDSARLSPRGAATAASGRRTDRSQSTSARLRSHRPGHVRCAGARLAQGVARPRHPGNSLL